MDEKTVEISVKEYKKLLNAETMMCRLALNQHALTEFIKNLQGITDTDLPVLFKYKALKFNLNGVLPILEKLQ